MHGAVLLNAPTFLLKHRVLCDAWRLFPGAGGTKAEGWKGPAQCWPEAVGGLGLGPSGEDWFANPLAVQGIAKWANALYGR